MINVDNCESMSPGNIRDKEIVPNNPTLVEADLSTMFGRYMGLLNAWARKASRWLHQRSYQSLMLLLLVQM